MFEKQSNNNQNAPKAGRTAKGAGIASVEANATGADYARLHRHRKQHVVHADGPAGHFVVTGQCAKALAALVKAGDAGITAQEVAGWAYRLAAYVHTLRQSYGLVIALLKEVHGPAGQWHGRYVLLSPVTILGPGT